MVEALLARGKGKTNPEISPKGEDILKENGCAR